MKLLLRRDQRSGVLGKVIFTLGIRADLSDAERDAIKRYKLGDCVLYARDRVEVDDSSFSGLAKTLAKHALNVTLHVRDLADGKTIECKEIVEMLAAEAQVKEAALTFSQMLRAAMHFGGDEVVEV